MLHKLHSAYNNTHGLSCKGESYDFEVAELEKNARSRNTFLLVN